MALIILLALSVVLGQVQNRARNAGDTDFASRAAKAVVTPGVVGLDSMAKGGRDQWTLISRGPALAQELQRLRQMEAAFKLYAETIDSKNRELEQLRGLVSMPNFGRMRVSARIIGYFPFENRITLSVGKAKGVDKGMPVVCSQGFVGLVQNVDASSCQVLLACSPDIKFGGLVQRIPEVPGLMKGQTPNRLVLDVLDNKVVKVGDPVVTSGLSDRVPRGIPVGTVAEVVPDPNYGTNRIFVSPSAQIGPSIEVMVLK